MNILSKKLPLGLVQMVPVIGALAFIIYLVVMYILLQKLLAGDNRLVEHGGPAVVLAYMHKRRAKRIVFRTKEIVFGKR